MPSEGDALFARIQENTADLAPQLIYADWLEENDKEAESQWWRGALVRSLPLFDLCNDGPGHGCGDGFADADDTVGHSHGDGTCSGFGSITATAYGDGEGYGAGNNLGFGDGNGYGDGHGAGKGNGFGEFGFTAIQLSDEFLLANQKIIKGKIMIGKNMLIWAGRGFAWVGHVEEMYAPGAYRLSNAGMLCRTRGDSWMHIANGHARDRYIYRHAPDGTVYTGGEIHGAVEWKGDLPGEDQR